MRTNRRQSGLGTVELAISAFALTIMVILCVDLGVMMLGNQVLDRAARDATRAAAAQSSQALAIRAAQAALRLHKTDGTFISQPVLTRTTSPDFVYQDFNGTPFNQTIPNSSQVASNATVTVTTKVDVLLPASLGIFGLSLQQGSLLNGKMTFRRQYTFPIVKQRLNQAFE